ncbi:MAG: cell division protein FtsZ, partial [Bacteroidetes bacterium]|nr:cell division protein FtsZ [Bacteroidota bacterium]
AIIQEEAGDDVEVIFGTVIDDAMGEELRITVIATGFDKAAASKPPRKPRVELEVPTYTQNPIPYKGEEGLKTLDTPAYERRGSSLLVGSGDGDSADESAESSTRVRLLKRDDISRHDEDAGSDSEVPAFLRKMMD